MQKKYVNYIAIIVFFSFLFFITQKTNIKNIKEVRVAGQSIKVELVLTEREHERGLSGRSELKENEGMLFVFDYPGVYSFWMKDMNFPIDIIWFAEDLKVVYIKKDARPESYPETYKPFKDAKYVLEVVSGFSEKTNLKEGDSMLFTY